MNTFQQTLERQGPLIVDGGLATQLETMGYDISSTLWSASLLVSDPRAIVDAHRAYLDAGADIIVTASYQASRDGFMSHGIAADDADRLILSSVAIAQTARDEFLADHPEVAAPPLIAASVGPYGAAQHDGSEYTGDYDVTDEALARFHAERLQILDQSGADLLAVETIPNFREAQVLRRLLDKAATPSWVSFACRDDRHLSDGSRLREAAGLFADLPGVLALGINCTPPQFVLPLIGELRAAAPGKAIVVYPNSGETYHVEDNSWSGTACDFEREFAVAAWYEAGAKVVGGCCRTGPADIAEIRSRLLA